MAKVTFVNKDGSRSTVDAPLGLSLMEIAHLHGIDIEGACEGSMACSTCHVILERRTYDALPPPCEEEDDMLDLAFGLTATSRLGCQIIMSAALDGIVVSLPRETRNQLVG
ncbi:MAG: 2Fe-2S iron-sulfur cluster binding domain-containing protein [Alphaproteobacteria bacterium]|nr:2Fe-2S iron-sulfur cluster binding domain-containing protein [Alphaproteobacteria bacterium]